MPSILDSWKKSIGEGAVALKWSPGDLFLESEEAHKARAETRWRRDWKLSGVSVGH